MVILELLNISMEQKAMMEIAFLTTYKENVNEINYLITITFGIKQEKVEIRYQISLF